MPASEADNFSSSGSATEPNPEQPAQEDAPAQPTGFADIARRIRGRTTDILAIAIVVVFGLSFGGRIVGWWSTDPETVGLHSNIPAGGSMPWETAGGVVSLEFGEHPYAIERQTLSGSRKQAVEALQGTVRPLMQQAIPPSGEQTQAETRLLARVAKLKASEEEQGVWQVFTIDRPLPMVVGVRNFGRKAASGNVKPAAADNRRVVCWGLAFPFSVDGWRLFAFHPTNVRRETLPGLPKLKLPKTARRILSLRDAGGGALVGFEGAGPGKEWAQHFDDWFKKYNWHRDAEWSRSGSGWNGRFLPRNQQNAGRIEIQFGKTDEAEWTGLLTVIPASMEIDNTEREQP